MHVQRQERAEHGDDADEQRQRRRDQAAEHDEQQQQRDRDGDQLGPPEVALDRRADVETDGLRAADRRRSIAPAWRRRRGRGRPRSPPRPPRRRRRRRRAPAPGRRRRCASGGGEPSSQYDGDVGDVVDVRDAGGDGRRRRRRRPASSTSPSAAVTTSTTLGRRRRSARRARRRRARSPSSGRRSRRPAARRRRRCRATAGDDHEQHGQRQHQPAAADGEAAESGEHAWYLLRRAAGGGRPCHRPPSARVGASDGGPIGHRPAGRSTAAPTRTAGRVRADHGPVTGARPCVRRVVPVPADRDGVEPRRRCRRRCCSALGAVGAGAASPIFGEKGCVLARRPSARALAGLVPWALVAGGVGCRRGCSLRARRSAPACRSSSSTTTPAACSR